jgi:hypothetical protein
MSAQPERVSIIREPVIWMAVARWEARLRRGRRSENPDDSPRFTFERQLNSM